MHIGIDLMGGDSPPLLLFEAVLQATERHPADFFIVFVTEEVRQAISVSYSSILTAKKKQIAFHTVEQVITMEEDPLQAIRRKKSSSMVECLMQLKKDELDAVVSIGNTGALIAGAKLLLTLLPGVQRPALLAMLPTYQGSFAMVDVGGNVACKANQLVQFAKLGSAYQRDCHGISSPRVGLLNIGVESGKGTSEMQLAHSLLQEEHRKGKISFVGNVEGHDVFRGKVDVLVTDGFTGNVFLKTAEGVSAFILNELREFIRAEDAVVRSLKDRLDEKKYSGAMVCGVNKVVIKCHGHTSINGLFGGILKAIALHQMAIVD